MLLALLRAPPPHGAAALFDLLSQCAASSRDVLLPSALPPVLACVPGERADRWAATHLILDPGDAEAAETARQRAAARLALPPWAVQAEVLEALNSTDAHVVERALLLLCRTRPLRAAERTDVAALLQRPHVAHAYIRTLSSRSDRRVDVTDYLHALARAVMAEPTGRPAVR